jgi:hypothetical protein
VTSIGNFAFEWCLSLTSVVISESVTSIGTLAFYGCENLTDVIFVDIYGWTVDGKVVDSSELSDSAKAAEYLCDTYVDYYWKRS